MKNKVKVDRSNYLFNNKALIALIIPLIVEQFLQAFVGLADSIMVASVGEAAVSGVSLVDTVMVLLINIFAALATGGAVVAGQYIGKKRPEVGCQAANQLMLVTFFSSVIVMIIGYLLRGFILHVVFGQISEEVLYNSNVYLLIVFASIPFIALYNAGAAIFRAMGNSKISMNTVLLMNTINLGGNALLIYGLDFGVEGVAIPTLVSRIVACVVILVLLFNEKYLIHFPKPFSFRLDGMLVKKILYIGVPNGLENSMFQLGKILVLSVVSGMGTASIAANAVSNNIAMFAVLPGMAAGFALVTVISQCVGANDYEQARYYTKKIIAMVYVLLILTNIVVLALLPFIMNIYNLSAEATAYTTKIVIYHSLCAMVIWPLSFTLANTLRAANDVRYTMFISIISMWTCRIGFSYVLGVYLGWGIFGVWVAMTLDWLVRTIFFIVHYCRGKWQYKYIA